MSNKLKVGDTFRVYEVITDEYKGMKGRSAFETNYDPLKVYPHKTLMLKGQVLFDSNELKQVGTIRIKSLKEK